MKVEDTFINYINSHYEDIKTKLKMLSGRNKQKFDEDIYHEALLRCYNAIKKKGKLNDTSAYGMESYLIRSYFNLIKEEARSCKNSKRDKNITSDNISSLYEQYYNDNNVTARNKILGDLYKDFSTLYIMTLVEDHFDSEHFYLFKLKHLCMMTYKEVCEKANCKGCRTKILEVKDWLKTNVTKEMVNKAFYELYGDLL